MKKTVGRITGEKTDRRNRRNIKLILLLFALFVVAQIEIKAQTTAACDAVAAQTTTRVSTPFVDPQTSTSVGYSRYDIWRNGHTDHYIHLFATYPANTVFKVFQNGVERGAITPVMSGNEISYWSWDVYWNDPNTVAPVGHVGDVITITKDGQPYLSGTYTREQVDYEAADGVYQPGNVTSCSLYRGRVSLPSSATPRMLRTYFIVARAPNQITKVALHEPSGTPNVPGAEIVNFAFNGTNTPSGGWYGASVFQTDTTLTESQFNLLRQNLLTVVIYTAQHPGGYAHIPIQTQGINSSGDFEGDGMTDLAVFRPSDRNWYINFSSNNQTQTISNFGSASDKLVVGDFDSDSRFDVTAWQTENPAYPGQGVWKILRSSDNSLQILPWGLSGDVPLSLDIDRNNTSDLGVFRPSNGTWYIHRMGDIIKPLAELGGQADLTIQWGMIGDKPLTGDFDGDGIDELVVFRPSEGNWYIYNYVRANYQALHWGVNGDIPMAKDFDGDRKANVAVYRPSDGTWYIYSSLEQSLIARRFGLSDDIPVPADFDKDGVSDIAVFRPSDGVWYVVRSSDNSFFAAQFGLNGDIPAVVQR